jgi:hypothetical protein
LPLVAVLGEISVHILTQIQTQCIARHLWFVKYNEYNMLLECTDECHVAQAMIYIRKIWLSNLSQDADCPAIIRGHTQPLQANVQMLLKDRPPPLCSIFSQLIIHNNPIIPRCSVGKNEVVFVHDVKVYRGSGGIAPLVLSLGTRWR